MRRGFWVAFAALAAAFLILVPTLAPLSGSMDAFSQDLANGTFRPFGPAGGGRSGGFSGSLGGFTGSSSGNYLPGAAEVPSAWLMDRDGTGGTVVIDAVFNPNLGAMKRLKAYDRLGADGSTLEVADKRLRPAAYDPFLRYEQVFEAGFQVQFRAGEPIPIFSPHPKAVVTTYRTTPALAGGVTFLRDGADTLYALAGESRTVALNLTFLSDPAYYALDPPAGLRATQYAATARPVVPPAIAEDARVVLARAGAGDGTDLARTLDALVAYFRSFAEGEIPAPSEVESLYLALALGGYGCCRHRAFAFMVTAQSVGIPTRVVVNEAHAFVEVMYPDGSWHQANLGGCGTYTSNNPNGYPDYFTRASDPRGEANPSENRALPTLATFTNITESPSRIVKGERYFVNGTVEDALGRPVAGARVDVFLNDTKEARGRLTGAGVTDAQGAYSVVARVPKELPARSYQLVARALDPGSANVRYEESWSDPEVNVFAPSKFLLPRLVAAAGFPANVTGRLVDIDNNPVAGANVTWSAEGAGGVLRTDATGRFVASVRFESTGEKPLALSYEGDEFHGPVSTVATVSVANGAIILPAEAPALARGEASPLAGEVAVAGVSLAGRAVRATLFASNATGAAALGNGTGETDARGLFAVPLEVARTVAPGLYPVRVSVPSLNLTTTSLARVAIRPTLEVEAPATLRAGDEWVVRARLVSDNGTALAGSIVEITLDGNASATRALLTNRTGVARFEFAGGAIEPGAHAVLVSFPGDAQHVEALARAPIEVVRPWYAAIPAWGYAAAAGALLLAGALAWLARPGTRSRALLARALGGERPPRWRIVVEHLDHPDGVLAVFEPGERVRARLLLRERDGRPARGRLVMLAPGARRAARVPEEGWIVEFPAEEGSILRARAAGLARWRAAPLEAPIAVRPYRQAVEEGFVALRRAAKLEPSASAGDLVRALQDRLAPERRDQLWRAAALFDEADYSERPVDRAFYHAFAAARRDLEAELEAQHG